MPEYISNPHNPKFSIVLNDGSITKNLLDEADEPIYDLRDIVSEPMAKPHGVPSTNPLAEIQPEDPFAEINRAELPEEEEEVISLDEEKVVNTDGAAAGKKVDWLAFNADARQAEKARVDAVEARMSALERRVSEIVADKPQANAEALSLRMDEFENKIQAMKLELQPDDGKLHAFDQRISVLEQKLNALDQKLNTVINQTNNGFAQIHDNINREFRDEISNLIENTIKPLDAKVDNIEQIRSTSNEEAIESSIRTQYDKVIADLTSRVVSLESAPSPVLGINDQVKDLSSAISSINDKILKIENNQSADSSQIFEKFANLQGELSKFKDETVKNFNTDVIVDAVARKLASTAEATAAKAAAKVIKEEIMNLL